MDKTIVVREGYEQLANILWAALDQAQFGKGHERHAAENGAAFAEQPIITISRQLGSVDGVLFQAIKKALESRTLAGLYGSGAAVAELYGAINYLAAAAIIYLEQREPDTAGD